MSEFYRGYEIDPHREFWIRAAHRRRSSTSPEPTREGDEMPGAVHNLMEGEFEAIVDPEEGDFNPEVA